MTVREALAESGAALKASGVETPSLDASLLLAHILNTSRTALVAAGADPLPEEKYAELRVLINRRLNGECAAYIIGKKEFRGLEFIVNSSVLVPRPDTETLIETAFNYLSNNAIMLDLCTGSGAIAVSLKNEMPHIEICASDISADALKTAKINAARLLRGGGAISFFLGDLYGALLNSHPLFSLIVCNPPYIPSGIIKTLSAEVRKEPRIALDGGPSGLEIIKRVINRAPDKLIRGGALLLEADPGQMIEIAILYEKRGFQTIKTYNDLSGRERVIGGIYV
ncbi:MAG: peptide chain release factor N(5)-glutamine methyltransferase [Treponema sp.]|jgi:release factor glutamine methyltransferase|nr:peptide chain release factor N(5)-glutamine methyltransferase [Treponema sp.]